MTWACTLEVVPFTPEPEPSLQLVWTPKTEMSDEAVAFSFNSNHNLVTGDRIVYNNNGNANLGIATTGSSKDALTLMSGQDYYIGVQDQDSIRLHF